MAKACTPRAGLQPSITGLALLCLQACGGGAGGGGQDPDPNTVDVALAYVERRLPPADAGGFRDELTDPAAFSPGAALYLRERAAPSARARNITRRLFDPGTGYDVKDLAVSDDGRRLLFALRAPAIENAGPEDQPTWNLWEYELDSDRLRRLVARHISAEEGHDIAPQYLPDGRIVFSSTRQERSREILIDQNREGFQALDEARRQPAFVLHTMQADGSDIRQISFNQSHDLEPRVLGDGRIAFSRQDNIAGLGRLSLYTVNPDGTTLAPLYGAHSQRTGTGGSQAVFLPAGEAGYGRLLALLRPIRSSSLGGALVWLDYQRFSDRDQPLPDADSPAGPGQVSALPLVVSTDGSPSSGGQFAGAYPLQDGSGRLLVSWSPCRLAEAGSGRLLPCTDDALARGDAEPAPPLYGIWMVDPREGTQKPVVTPAEGRVLTDAVALGGRTPPRYRPDSESSQATGLLAIDNVYATDGVVPSQPSVAWLRIVKAVSLPDDGPDATAFGRSGFLREILGYAEVRADGSVEAQVPADVAFTVSLVDERGRRLSHRHDNWLQLRPGETRRCAGCHDPAGTSPHGRPDAEATVPTAGQPLAEGDASPLSLATVFAGLWADRGEPAPLPSTDFPYQGQLPDIPYPPIQCGIDATSNCRIVIDYPAHIQPIWDRERPELGAGKVPDPRCTVCHSTATEVDDAPADQLPAAQLALDGTPSTDEADHATSYRELLFNHPEQALNEGALEIVRVPVTDAFGNPQFDANGEPVTRQIDLPPLLSPAGATASGAFFARFAPGASHAGWLYPGELRLIAEWLDIGAQYRNDPGAGNQD